MASLNQVQLIGNLGRDVELKATSSGLSVALLSIATTRRVKVNDEWQNETEWHRVTLFGNTADFANNYARKGNQVFVQGRLQTRKWQDQNGQDRYTTEIIAENFQLLGNRSDNESQNTQARPAQQRPAYGGFESAPRQNRPAAQSYNKDAYQQPDEDIPF